MANDHFTEIALPALDDLMDAVDEYAKLNAAFECYHELITSFLFRCADRPIDKGIAKRFVSGLDTLFYSNLARSERVGEYVHSLAAARDSDN